MERRREWKTLFKKERKKWHFYTLRIYKTVIKYNKIQQQIFFREPIMEIKGLYSKQEYGNSYSLDVTSKSNIQKN